MVTTKKFNGKTFKFFGYINTKLDAKESLSRISYWAYGRITRGKDGIYQTWYRKKRMVG
jgi:hypothetical protein